MEWQLQNFKQTYGNLVEFTYLDGFYEVGRENFEPFRERGFKGPFRMWGDFDYNLFSEAYRDTKWDIPKTEPMFNGIEKSLFFIIKYLEESPIKFDGMCGFSQGAVTISALWTAFQYFQKHFKPKVTFPSFVIIFSFPVFDFMGREFNGKFSQPTYFHGGVESLHILNDKLPEPYYLYMNQYRHFENPTVIIHNESHKPPTFLTLSQLHQILDWLERQLKLKEIKADIQKVRNQLPLSSYLRKAKL